MYTKFFILSLLGLAAITAAGQLRKDKFIISYTSYNDNTCSQVDNGSSGQIFSGVCAPEYRIYQSTGKIVFINDDYLTSCDYSDDACGNLTVCENYTKNVCYSSSSVSFSNQYSWENVNGSYVNIMYTSYTDSNCSHVNPDMTGEIYANVCAPEFREEHQTGKIVFINDYYLTSCDYSDDSCGEITVCENYTNGNCYASMVAPFSNKYSWVREDSDSDSGNGNGNGNNDGNGNGNGNNNGQPTGSNPTGSNPTGSNPTGSNPTGSNPTGSNPTGSNPTGSGSTTKSSTTSSKGPTSSDKSSTTGSKIPTTSDDPETSSAVSALASLISVGIAIVFILF